MALFSALSTLPASLRPSSTVPETNRAGESHDPSLPIFTPRALRHLTVARQSPPGAKLSILALPLAKLFRMTARWEIDLSPGGIISPSKLVQCLMVFISALGEDGLKPANCSSILVLPC